MMLIVNTHEYESKNEIDLVFVQNFYNLLKLSLSKEINILTHVFHEASAICSVSKRGISNCPVFLGLRPYFHQSYFSYYKDKTFFNNEINLTYQAYLEYGKRGV